MLALAIILAAITARGAIAGDGWAFRPVRRPEVPGGRGEHPVDAFVRRAQQKAGVSPSPEADRATLIRRLSVDLRGLPPTPGEVDTFLADDEAGAYERLVDAFLASADYGERQAQHWLDVARYADSAGFEDDARRPDAWRYRDWVVDAYNADLPYDRFVALQLAADEVAPDEPRHKAALGFLRAGPSVGNERGERVRMEELDDVVSATGSAFLGLTLGCARCHDHKLDPIPAEDYYRMVAVFAPARFDSVPLATDEEVARYKAADRAVDELADVARAQRIELERPARARVEADRLAGLAAIWREAIEQGRLRSLPKPDREAIAGRLAVSEADIREALSAPDRAAWAECKARIDRVEADRPRRPDASPGVVETSGRAAPVHVLIRGEIGRKGEVVRPGPPRLNGEPIDFPDPPDGARSTNRRARLAAWIVDPTNPLTARVEVNRIWQGHFGEGLVRTPADFGAAGDEPAMPDLLDWLASEFVARGWSRKAIHRLIVTGATYRQSSRSRPDMARLDPSERLVWRHPLRRLDGEAIRDAILWCAGTLNPARGGPGVFPPLDPRLVRTGNIPRWPADARDGPEVWRRSLYLFRMRSLPDPLLSAFDLPDLARSCPRREPTVVPTQALTLWNGPFAVAQARRFAARVAREAGEGGEARAMLAFRLATGRAPSEGQLRSALDYLRGAGDLEGLCLALLNSNGFLYVD